MGMLLAMTQVKQKEAKEKEVKAPEAETEKKPVEPEVKKAGRRKTIK